MNENLITGIGEPENVKSLIPFADLRGMAEVMAKTGMFGKNAEQTLALMLIAQAEGLHPAIAVQEYDIIKGKPAINSRAALARFQRAGGRITWNKRTDEEAAATFSHPAGGELTISWTIARAKQAGLTGKDNWRQYPAQMLSARVVAEGVRAIYPACLSGLYTVEEVQDFSTVGMVDVTPVEIDAPGIHDAVAEINKAGSIEELKDVFMNLYARYRDSKPATEKLIVAKNDRKRELTEAAVITSEEIRGHINEC